MRPALVPGGLAGYNWDMAKIHVLPPETARLIAAGEVIERPASVLRELLDNALDAGATEILVEIEGGGIGSLRVVDDGAGMDADDLALSILPHATSKISNADDLLRATSLGFRGEALASIAAAALLELTSKDENAREARRLSAGPGRAPTIEATQGKRGTIAQVSQLFADFPARRQFLKRPQTEGGLCKQLLVDKALPHPGVAFRLTSEGKAGLIFPGVERIRERVLAAYPDPPESLVNELRFSGEGFQGRIVIAGPSFYRNDRRLMQVFVNRRRVQDFSLIGTLDYAFEGYLPGGAHPYAFLFVEMDPALADFNIHPAKKEVRLKDPSPLRHGIIATVGDFLRELSRRRPGESAGAEDEEREQELSWPSAETVEVPYARAEAAGGGAWAGRSGGGSGQGFAGSGQSTPISWERLAELRERAPALPRPQDRSGELRYIGKAFGLFLLVERGEELFLIDQHAAHERILFDELSQGVPSVQELLVPVRYEPENDAEEKRITELASSLASLGFRLERSAGGEWLLTALPALLREDPEGTLREILSGGQSDPARAARALAACRAAVKDGDELEPEAAQELAARALALPEPRCPHGRPIWVRLTRNELFRLVRRIL